MSTHELEGLRIAVLAADGFEQVELTRPVKAMEKHGAQVEIVSLRRGSIRGMNLLSPDAKVRVDRTLRSADPDEYHGLHIPGGFVSPDFLRQSEQALDFVRAIDASGKPISTLCHGPWVLISAGLARGRRVAAWPGIKDDVVNAGGEWVDETVVWDGNWVTSRSPLDLPSFDEAIIEHFATMSAAMAPSGGSGSGIGRFLAGTAAAAVVGYAVRERLRHRREGDGRALARAYADESASTVY